MAVALCGLCLSLLAALPFAIVLVALLPFGALYPLLQLSLSLQPDAREPSLALLLPWTLSAIYVALVAALVLLLPIVHRFQSIRSELLSLLKLTVALRKRFRTLAGKIGFVAGLVPALKPFLAPLWKAASPGKAAHDTPGPRSRRARGGKLPQGLVLVAPFRPAIRWLLAFFERQRGTLTRTYSTKAQASQRIQFICDASPWGIGGVRYEEGRPTAYFADSITQCDLQRFRASLGDSASLTIWEALAVLVGMRIRQDPDHSTALVSVRSDSLGALLAASKASSPSPELNIVLREIALEDAELGSRIHCAQHIPGMANDLADALSRLSAPEPKPVALVLRHIPRTPVPRRDRSWWLTNSRRPRPKVQTDAPAPHAMHAYSAA